MEQAHAELISTLARIVAWAYFTLGIAFFALFFIFCERRPIPLFRWPTPAGLTILAGIWLLNGLASPIAKRLVEGSVPPTTLLGFVSRPITFDTLLNAALEEFARSGILQLFGGIPILGVWLNAAIFGFAHLAERAAEIASYPQIAFLLPLDVFSFAMALTFVLIRLGLFWAILVHFASNAVRLVLITDSEVLNVCLFLLCIVALMVIAIRGLQSGGT